MSSNVNSRKRRRASPSYDDYLTGEKDDRDTIDGGKYIKPGRLERQNPALDNGHHPPLSLSHRYHARSQPGNYRQESDEDPSRPPRSASPQHEISFHKTTSPPYLFRDSSLSPSHRLSRLSPPPKRAEPTDDYLLTSRERSRPLNDPTQSRKLAILDLNGSLLFRSPHSRKAGRGIQPRLRAVYPRPYFPAFRSYIFHEETKRWLDVMVWSSAQPHSVHDMVDKCFRDRKGELRAIWARDTLGLKPFEYNQKTQTLKDLEKPWAELDEDTPHSALTTVLIDDSPLKAALQPWNHLCIKEYVAETRSSDLNVANWEAARRRLHGAREALEREIRQKEELKREEEEKAERLRVEEEKLLNEALNNPENTKVIKEVAMVKGKVVGEERVVKKVLKEVVMRDGEMVGEQEDEGLSARENENLSAKNRKRKLKRLAKKEAILQTKEELALEASKAVEDSEIEEGEIGCTELEQEQEDEEMRLEALAPKMQYDETLLAVIGVLDHLKSESSVAGWMRHGGLLNIEVAEDASLRPPAKRRRLNPADSFDGKSPSSPTTLPQGDPLPRSPSRRVEERDEQAQTGVPVISQKDPDPPSSSLWFERPVVLSYWADRGRRALEALDIPAETGI